jgi:hypothetical protein
MRYISSWNDNSFMQLFLRPIMLSYMVVNIIHFPWLWLGGAKQGDLFTLIFPWIRKPYALSVRSFLMDVAQNLSGRTVIVTSSAGVGALRYWGHGVVMPVAHDIAGAEALRPFSYDVTAVPLLFCFLDVAFVGNMKIENCEFLYIYCRYFWFLYSSLSKVFLDLASS